MIRRSTGWIWPVDIPLVSPRTLVALIAAWRRGHSSLVYPVYEGRRGHPPPVALDLLSSCLDWDLPGGLRTLLRRYESDALEIRVSAPAILVDCDTPPDYARLRTDPACLLEEFRV